MVYKKYRRYRRKYKRAAAGTKALKKVNKLARLVSPEKKFDLSYNSGSNIDYNGYSSATLANNQGVTNAQHIGERIAMQYAEFRVMLFQTGAGVYSSTRILLYVDKANISPGSNIWAITGASNAPIAPLNQAYSKDVVVLKDWTVDMTSGSDSGVITKTFRIPLKGRQVQFNANTNTVMANQIRIAAISSVAPAGTMPTLFWTCKIQYTDC